MPGHVDGFSCFASFTFASPDPMDYTSRDWERLEKAIEKALKTMRIEGHKITSATVVSMGPTASSISKHVHRAERGARKKR